ncbi:MAG: aldehyde dehydrogenase family protein [Haloarculaceae archaeon]
MSQRHNYVDGEWTDAESGERTAVYNPADTDELVNEYPASSVTDAERAVAAADAASEAWASTPAPERGSILREAASVLDDRREELTELLVREEGKTRPEAAGEVGRAVDIFYYYGEKAADLGGGLKSAGGSNRRIEIRKEPQGVAALITPWNYPIAIPAWKLAPALATGNAAVLKPAEIAPGVAGELLAALDEAGIPDGVANVVYGSGSEIGPAIIGHDDVDVVSFTGSAEVGHMVYEQAVEDVKRAQAEMGGKNPAVVSATADLETAIDEVAGGAFGVTGQACTATSRAIVHEDVHDEFLDRIVARAESLEVGDGLAGADVGPHVSADELETTLNYVEVGQNEGATLETGGKRLEDGDYAGGYFVSPAVFSGVESGMRIAQEEIFGPVLAVIEVSDFEEAVEVANDSQYGLSASVFSEDHSEIETFLDEIESGVAKVNEKTTGLELHVPFGGMKRSSTNTYREQGDAALDFYTKTKTVYRNY